MSIDTSPATTGRIAAQLREAREYMGFTQEEVAEKISLGRTAITGIENGRRKVTAEELARFAALYNRPLDYFIGSVFDTPPDELSTALFRATQGLTKDDKEQILKFAQFLRHAGKAPSMDGE